MSKLTVPCFYGLLDSEYEEDSVKKHLLYEIRINKTDEFNVWTYEGGGGERDIQKKFLNLQEYLKDRYKTEQPWLDFYLRTLNAFTPKVNKEEKRQIYLKEITKSSTSVFLGIFLEALQYTRGRQFKGAWNTICVTGDVEYDKENKKLKLIHAVDIEDKFNGEFTAAANNTYEKCLFVYIGDKEEKIPYGEDNGNNKNITVKHFTKDNDIQDIIDYLFDKEHRQQELMSRTEENNPYNTFIEYRHEQDFPELEQEILNDFNILRGYFIRGIGGSGKSAFAIKTARILYDNNKIYAPVWINAETKVIRDCIKKDLDTKINITKFSKTAIDLNEKLNVIEENETEKYIINKIIDLLWEGEEKTHLLEKLLKEKIISVKNKLSAEKYLLIIDNIELHEKETDYFIEAVKNLFSNMEKKPYLIITSRHKYGKVEELKLKGKNVPLLNKTLIGKIIKDAAQSDDTIKDKITAAKGSGLFANLADVIDTEYGRNPRLIITSIFLLKKSTELNELIEIIKKKHGRYKDDLRGQEINIYEQSFLDLNELEKKVLYMFLSFGSDVPVSNEEIYNEIRESGLWKKPPAQFELNNALDTLYNFYIITRTSRNNKQSYMIGSSPYQIFLFEEEFLHSNPEETEAEKKDCMRDKFIDLDLQLKIALEYDMDTDIIEPLLERMKVNNILSNNELFLKACSFSSKDAVFSLLKDYGFDPDIRDENDWGAPLYAIAESNEVALGWLFKNAKWLLESSYYNEINVFEFAVIIEADSTILDWLWEHANKKLLERISNKGATAFHYAVLSDNPNARILDWLWEHANKKLLNQVDVNGGTVFHLAVLSDNPNAGILDWLWEHANKKLLDQVDNDGWTVFHYAVSSNNPNTEVLNWLLENAKKRLLDQVDNHGGTVFNWAVLFDNPNTKVLDWLLENAEKGLLDQVDNDEWTVFHYAVKSNNPNTEVLNWLLENAEKGLLAQVDNDGRTIFHWAVMFDNLNTKALDWLLENAEKGLLAQVDNDGRTVFHWAVMFDNPNTKALDWLLENAEKGLLAQVDNDGRTVFHSAVSSTNPNIEVLNWLLENAEKGLLDQVDIDGGTVFNYAVSSNNPNTEVLDWLLGYAKKGLLDCVDNDGYTVFHSALTFANPNTEVLQWLLENAEKGLLDQVTNDGYTVFHCAAMSDNPNTEVLDWLWDNAEKGLLNRSNNDGKTAFNYAIENNNTDIINWFLAHKPENTVSTHKQVK